jgi:hypothetical protein
MKTLTYFSVLNEHVDKMASLLKDAHKIEEYASASLIHQVLRQLMALPVWKRLPCFTCCPCSLCLYENSFSQDDVSVVGRICCDTNGKLNASSLILRESGTNYSGASTSVSLNVSDVNQYSLFPGKVACLMICFTNSKTDDNENYSPRFRSLLRGERIQPVGNLLPRRFTRFVKTYLLVVQKLIQLLYNAQWDRLSVSLKMH